MRLDAEPEHSQASMTLILDGRQTLPYRIASGLLVTRQSLRTLEAAQEKISRAP